MHHPKLFIFFSVVLCLSLSQAATAKKKQIGTTSTFTGTISKDQKKLLNGKSYISDKKTFEKIWGKWHPKKEVPKVDFNKSIILTLFKNDADPNRHFTTIMLDEKGAIQVLSQTTLIGFKPSDNFKYWLYVVKRDGIKGVKRYDPATRKMVVDSIATDKKEKLKK